MNRIAEYFPILNILDPTKFSSPGVLESRCYYINNKPTALRPQYRDWWDYETEQIFIKRTDEELAIPKPPISIDTIWVNAWDYKANDQFMREYNSLLDDLEKMLMDCAVTARSLIGIMSQIRHYTGVMKVGAILEHAINWLEIMPEDEKLCIGIHHKLVRQALTIKLSRYGAVSMSDESAEEKDEIERKFRDDPKCRVLIASITSAGQGRNLQFCKTAILAERQWNPEREKQFVGRFQRIIRNPDGSIKTNFTSDDKVSVTKFNLTESFDEFMDPTDEMKAQIIASVDEDDFVPDLNVLKNLAQQILNARAKHLRM